MIEEQLAGNVGGVLRRGDVVLRPTGYWTPAVHDLLGYLNGRLDRVPAVLGVDDAGRERVTYLPGEVIDIDAEALSPARIASLARWARRFHDVVAGYGTPARRPGPWRYFPVPGATIIGHNDLAPYNVCFDGDEVAGVFDWDLAGPTTPLNELAFLAWNCVPLWRELDPREAAERLRVLTDGYGGMFGPDEVLRAVPARITIMLDGIPAAAAAGDPGMANLMTQGEPERSRRSLDALVDRIPAILSICSVERRLFAV